MENEKKIVYSIIHKTFKYLVLGFFIGLIIIVIFVSTAPTSDNKKIRTYYFEHFCNRIIFN